VNATVGELERFLAYVFQAKGRKRLLEEDIVSYVAHERRLLAPSKVRSLVQAAKARGHIKAAGAHAYELARELEDVRIEFDYRPDAGALEASLSQAPAAQAPLTLFRRIVRAIRDQSQDSEADIIAKVNQVQQSSGRLLRAEVAALVVAAQHGIEIMDLAKEVQDEIQRTSRPAGAR
jgi:hypothetical protein